jgi:hypothetical protein
MSIDTKCHKLLVESYNASAHSPASSSSAHPSWASSSSATEVGVDVETWHTGSGSGEPLEAENTGEVAKAVEI